MDDKDRKQAEDLGFGLEDIRAVKPPTSPLYTDKDADKNPLEDQFQIVTEAPQPLAAMCPYLGLAHDRVSRFAYPQPAHRCFSAGQVNAIPLEHQSAFCFTRKHQSCSRLVELSSEQISATISPSPAREALFQALRMSVPWRVMLWLLAVLLVGLPIIYYARFFIGQSPSTSSSIMTRPTPFSPSVLPPEEVGGGEDSHLSTGDMEESGRASSPNVALASSIVSTPTPVPGGRVYAISAAAADIGWVSSGEDRGNHFGDSFLYAGIFQGQIYHGAFQFDLSLIPRGAPIHEAAIQLTGLRDDRLGQGGTWMLRLLGPEIDQDWRRHNYQDIFNAPALQTLSPILGEGDLEARKTNTFVLSADQIRILENRIIDDENPKVSFRLDGPLAGQDNLFVWDTGYGSQSQNQRVTLLLNVGPPPATPPPYDIIVVTSTPTPENVLTAAAIMLQMTVEATRIGTATPTPPNMVTATPFPPDLIITPTPTPENKATAEVIAALETAYAATTGTPTPFPTNAVTATPVPSATPTATFVLITATPTPQSVFAAATLAALGTAQAETYGLPTPLPANWVTPIVVTDTPTPRNAATAQAWADMATAQAFTTGTPTATPVNVVTATPTPVYILLEGELPPMTSTPLPVVRPERMPPELIGKIAFKSDRTGQEEIYVINPDGSELALLSDRWPYELARQADAYSADGRFRVFTKGALRYNPEGRRTDAPALYWYDALYEAEEQLTFFGTGFAYDGAWSPTAEQIAFVSNDSQNDEIWVVNRDGSGLQQLTRNEWEWDKHPSWSPDGRQIVFWSNRSGTWQIWVMDAGGSNLYSLSRTGFNDWDPVWIKYLEMPEFEQVSGNR